MGWVAQVWVAMGRQLEHPAWANGKEVGCRPRNGVAAAEKQCSAARKMAAEGEGGGMARNHQPELNYFQMEPKCNQKGRTRTQDTARNRS